MADFSQVNPQNLEAIFSQNPGMWGMAQDYMQRANAGNDLTQQHQQLQNQWEQDSQPFRLTQLGLGNDTTAAQLPGVRANSAIAVRKNQFEDIFTPQMMQEMKGKYSSAELARHVKDIENIGELYSQAASSIASNPDAGRAKLKKALEDAGHSDMYNPEWDNTSPDKLFQSLDTAGKQIQMTSSKFRTGLGILDAKGDNAKELADLNNASREKIASSRTDTLKALQAAKGTQDPKTIEAAMVKAMSHAQIATDPQEQAAFYKAAEAYKQQLEALALVKAQAGKANDVDVPGVANLPRNNAPSMPPIQQTPLAPTAPPAPPASGQRIRVQAPDGKKYTLPIEQVEEALKQGFTRIQ